MVFGLPNNYYFDPAVLEAEKAALFRRSWQIVGRESQLRAPGDYLTSTIADEPLVVVRDDERRLHAFANVCAHRGMRLAANDGHCTRFVCPYHSWIYDLHGQLQSVPFARYLPEDFEKSKVRLPPALVDTWGGFVFVNLDLSGDGLKSFLGEMVARWQDYNTEWEALQEVEQLTYDDEQFNWKIFMENSTDYYHIPFIHQGSLSMPPVFATGAAGPHFMLTTATPEENYRRYFDLVFPNNYFHIAPNKIQHFRVVPKTPETCRVEVTLYQTPAQMDAYPLSDPTKHREVSRILDQDFAVCRVLQEQARSRHFRVRYTASDLEDGVNHFDATVLAALLGAGVVTGAGTDGGLATSTSR